MITHSSSAAQRLTVLFTIVVAASVCFSAAFSPAPIPSDVHRVHAAAATLVLM